MLFRSRNLRAIYNDFIAKNPSLKNSYPFSKKGYTIPATKGTKRALRKEDLLKLFEITPTSSHQQKAKDFWFLSFFCGGINIIHDMSNVRKIQMYNFKEIGEKRVNDILKSISSLNTSIMNSQLHGKEPLELLDQRNLLLDELSEYVDIRVEYNKVEVSKGVIIEEPTVYLNTQ